MSLRLSKLSVLSAVFLGLSGCVNVPAPSDLEVPQSVSDGFVNIASAPILNEPPPKEWWRIFNDPVMDGLVEDALAENADLRIAAANLDRVRANLSATRDLLIPNVSASASAEYARLSGPSAGPVSGGVDDDVLYRAGLDLSYELDLFGRVRNTLATAKAEADSTEALLNEMTLIIVAETSRAYAQYCAASVQIEVAERSVGLLERSLELTQSLENAGRSTRLDVARARSAVQSAKADLPLLQSNKESSLFRLGTLTGRTPREISHELSACDQVPSADVMIPSGDGYSLLARRPDVRRAEYDLAAAAARVGIAWADFFPSVSLGGSVTSSALELSNIGSSDSLQFSIGPLISWQFSSYAAANARYAGAEADVRAAAASYRQSVLVALEEAETAFSKYARELERVAALEKARDAAAEAAELAQARYKVGVDTFLSVLDADRTLADAEEALIRSRAEIATTQVDIFRVLAGNW